MISLKYPNTKISFEKDIFENCVMLKTVTIIGSGNMQNYDLQSLQPWFSLQNILTTVIVENTVSSIVNYTFYEFTKLTSISFNGVKTIGSKSFEGCISLPSISIPTSVTTISSNAFKGCTNLEFVDYPVSIKTDTNDIFQDCSKLTTLNIIGEGELKNYENNQQPWSSIKTQITTISIGNKVTSISSYAFEGTSITSITLPDSIETISSNVFENCSKLQSIIMNKVKSIGSKAFASTVLTTINLPQTVTTLGSQVFYNCKSMTSIKYPISVTEFESNIFEGCSNLVEITITGEGQMKNYTSEK
jgi:hypothetical protein